MISQLCLTVAGMVTASALVHIAIEPFRTYPDVRWMLKNATMIYGGIAIPFFVIGLITR